MPTFKKNWWYPLVWSIQASSKYLLRRPVFLPFFCSHSLQHFPVRKKRSWSFKTFSFTFCWYVQLSCGGSPSREARCGVPIICRNRFLCSVWFSQFQQKSTSKAKMFRLVQIHITSENRRKIPKMKVQTNLNNLTLRFIASLVLLFFWFLSHLIVNERSHVFW